MALLYRKLMDALYLVCVVVAGTALVLISAVIPWAVFTRYVLNSASVVASRRPVTALHNLAPPFSAPPPACPEFPHGRVVFVKLIPICRKGNL